MREDFVNKNDQQIPQVYFQNGAIYIFTIKSFLKIDQFQKQMLYLIL